MSRVQQHWDLRAALNFMLGGAGAGLMIAAAITGSESRAAFFLSLALVAAGLLAVWLEIGRKLRALNVFFNPFSSWMTREAFAAALLFPLGLGAFFLPQSAWGAGLAAAAFLYCQARILRAARGIPAWRAPAIVPLVVATGLAEGAGLLLLFGANSTLAAIFATLVIARALAWLAYRRQARSEALEAPGQALLYAGTLASLTFLYLGLPWLAALAAVAGGWWLKHALVTRASRKQPFVLPRLPVRGVQ
jgi:phenylacetyl-CoA:acceptor oxidoreductase subunit 2